MGWLGWTEAETLDTSMPAISLAYEGRLDMLRALFGGSEKPPEEPKGGDDLRPDPDLAEKLKFAFRDLGARRKLPKRSG